MSAVKLSVVIPVFNTDQYLRQCLESIVSQTLAELQIICVDDGSTDQSVNIIEEYVRRDNRITLCHTDRPASGPGRARNIAIELASGTYIGFVDSDDYIHPTMYSTLYSCAEEHSLSLAICSVVKFKDQDNRVYGRCSYDRFVSPDLDGRTFTWRDMGPELFRVRFTACNKVYRRDFLTENAIRFPEDVFYEDMNFTYRSMLRAEGMRLVRQGLYFNRRQREGATTHSQGERALGSLAAFDELEQFLTTSGEYADLLEPFMAFKTRKLLRYLYRNGPDHIARFYDALQAHVQTPGLLRNPYLSEDERKSLARVQCSDLVEYLTASLWEASTTIDGLKRTNKELSTKVKKLRRELATTESRHGQVEGALVGGSSPGLGNLVRRVVRRAKARSG